MGVDCFMRTDELIVAFLYFENTHKNYKKRG